MPDETTSAEKPLLEHEPPLEDDPSIEDGLIEHELPSRPRRRLLGVGGNPIPVALLCVLLTACGFIGGVLVQKGEGGSASASSGSGGLASRLAALRSGGNGGGSGTTARAAGAATLFGGGASGGGGSSGGTTPTIGQVAFVHGHTLYVTDFEGNTIKITASAGASVTKTVKSSVKAIHPGETVIVTGASAGNGAVSAQSIRVSEAGAGGGLGAALFGGGGGGGLAGARGGGESTRGGGGGSGAATGASGTGGGGEGPVLFGK